MGLLKPVFRKVLIDAHYFPCTVESIFYACLTAKVGFARIKLTQQSASNGTLDINQDEDRNNYKTKFLNLHIPGKFVLEDD